MKVTLTAVILVVSSTTSFAAASDVPHLDAPDAMSVEVLHDKPGELVIVMRNALSATRANELLREAMRLAHPFPAPGAGTSNGRGRVSFPMEPKTLLLHPETRMALRGASARLHAAGNAASAEELAELAGRLYTSVGGALLYDANACLRLHLDDIAACNSNPFDARDVLWNFGNDCNFKWLPATTTARWKWETRGYTRDAAEKIVKLRHGDALLINVEKIAHGVKVLASCADAEARRLLGDRRVCVPVRPKASDAEERQHATDRAALSRRPRGGGG